VELMPVKVLPVQLSDGVNSDYSNDEAGLMAEIDRVAP
jgi:hypothetical protein